MGLLGLKSVLANLNSTSTHLQGTMLARMDYVGRDVVNHMKEGYDRPKTGKGFTDDTTNLRNSMNHKPWVKPAIIGVTVYVVPFYGPIVELGHGGRFAYMHPAVMDKKKDILDALGTRVF